MNKNKLRIAIIGATGLVGRTLLEVLEESNYSIEELRLIASEKSFGKILRFRDKEYTVESLNSEIFKEVDFAFFCTNKEISKDHARLASRSTIVIDNSSAFRQDPNVPLVVPGVNDEDIKDNTLIANPNCSTIPSVMILKALSTYFQILSVNYSTYQATSGSGMKGLIDLAETRKGNDANFYPYPIASTCIPEVGESLLNNYTTEEEKMINETRKILHMPNLLISATCVRVPIEIGHGVVMRVEIVEEFSLANIRKILKEFPNIEVVDDLKQHIYPTSTLVVKNDTVYVGRIRKDKSCYNGILLYHVSNNLRTGAASNAFKIMEQIVKDA